MKLSVTGSETYTLTAPTIDKIIRTGDPDAALLYLYTLRTKGDSTNEKAAKDLNMGIGAVNTATALLSRMGLIEIETEPVVKEPEAKESAVKPAANMAAELPVRTEPVQDPHYTQDEVIAEIASGTDFTVVVDETTRRLGKPLSADELLRLYGIYDNLRLPPEVILQLITHCINECRHSGSGRLPSVRYIEKAAYTWEREGLFTIEKAEEYLKALEQRRSERYKVKQILQVRDREFSETEKRYVDNWLTMGFETEVIAEAYDRTVVKTGKLSYPYMDTILKSWDSKGLHTIAQVQEKDNRKHGSGNNHTFPRQSGQKHGTPNREQLDRMSRMIKKMGEE